MKFTIVKNTPLFVKNDKGSLVNIYVDKVEEIGKTANLPTNYELYSYQEILAKFNITKDNPFIIEEKDKNKGQNNKE